MVRDTANPQELLLDQQVGRLKNGRFAPLRFSQELEAQFERTVGGSRALRMSRDGLLIILIYNLFLISDYQVMPHRIWLAVLLRTCVFTPIAFVIYAVLRREPSAFVREGSIVVLSGVAATCAVILYWRVNDQISTHAPVSLMLILLVSNIVMRLRFSYAIASMLFCNLTSIAFLVKDPFLQPIEKVHMGGLVFWGGVFILIANYSLEREERLAYLLLRSNELKRVELSEANRELELISTHDPMTQLANRSAFEKEFEVLWNHAAQTRQPISAVMIDIDHFKIVNDTQGHLYGDEVIKRVALLIQQALRGKDDFAARYGGEEFVLLLPGASLESAMKVAERIRQLIKMAGSPAPSHPVPQPEIGLWTTVSCGVASAQDVEGIDRRRLLLAADTALYTAKAEGRNRVCAAPLLEPVSWQRKGYE
ncbi:GGDEF domain-containing protein [Terriglobus albidus]|uniref:GGDEF domain-containing protein n=1 Tax=Terriglobus albidus TaxID=1592106 RepID=UPI00164CF4E7|nr:GGDEF domain-containing protein [Terriglobus albidus]